MSNDMITNTLLEAILEENKELKDRNNYLTARLNEMELDALDYTTDQVKLLYKIQKVKHELNQKDIKMTGYNSYKDYNYFELKDFVPCAVSLMLKHNISSHFFVRNNKMYLDIVDAETGACISTSTSLKEVARDIMPKGDIGVLMKDQQTLHTYARRTLWLLMLELVEPVSIEMEAVKKETTKNQPELQLPDTMPETVADVFHQIKKDFGTKIEFNSTTLKNKLNSMKNNQKIDKTTYDMCMGIINENS